MSIEDIKLVISIYSVLDLYGIKYGARGMQETIACPFHSEEKPSARIYPDANKLHCFGACARSFDVVDTVMMKEGLSLPEAMRFLEEKFNIEGLRVEAATKFWQNLDAFKRKKEKQELLGLIYVMGKDIVKPLRALPEKVTIPFWVEFDKIVEDVSSGEKQPDQQPIQDWYRRAKALLEVRP